MELREIAGALGPDGEVTPRLRKGTVSSGGGTKTAQVSIGGAADRPVQFVDVAPADGSTVWVVEQGPVAIGLNHPDYAAAGHEHRILRGDDTRSVADTPADVRGNRTADGLEFKSAGTLGLPGSFYGVMTYSPWGDDSGGGIHQLAFGDGGNGAVYHRYGTSGGGWQDWRIVVDDTGWINATYLNGWSTYGANWPAAQYRRKDGLVYIRGLVRPGTLAQNIFQLPAGFRPITGGTTYDNAANTHVRGLGCDTGETGYLLRGDGTLCHWNVGNAPSYWLDLAGVRPFFAEQ